MEITEAAVDALKSIRQSGPYEDEADVRIQLVQEGQERGIGLSFEEPPRKGDEQIAEGAGMNVFLSHELVGPLGSAVLDVQETAQGKELTLREQGDQGHEGHDHG